MSAIIRLMFFFLLSFAIDMDSGMFCRLIVATLMMANDLR